MRAKVVVMYTATWLKETTGSIIEPVLFIDFKSDTRVKKQSIAERDRCSAMKPDRFGVYGLVEAEESTVVANMTNIAFTVCSLKFVASPSMECVRD